MVSSRLDRGVVALRGGAAVSGTGTPRLSTMNIGDGRRPATWRKEGRGDARGEDLLA